MPAFSIVIPCFNAEATLTETLRSVEGQTFGDFEVIIIDDGSCDNSVNIAKTFTQRDPRFRVVEIENGGPSRARNVGGMYYASGAHIAFLDADDLWAPEKLGICAAAFSVPNAPDALYARVAFFRGAPELAKTQSTVLPDALTVHDLLKENAVCTMSNIVVSAAAFRRSGGFDPQIVHGEDVEWLVRLAASGTRIEALDKCLTFYRASDAGLSADLEAMQAGWRAAVASARELGVEFGEATLNAAEAVHLRYLARRALRVRVPRGTALRLAFNALGKSPQAFFAHPFRGALTLVGALVEPFMPDTLRRLAFAH